jgi:hypothetical protein
MLRKEPLEYFPSMNPASIVLHHKWKIGQKDSPLLDEGGRQLLDLDGKPIKSVGTWISPENLEQYRSAISTLHKARNMIGSYQKPCEQCIELDNKGSYHGCRFHCSNAQLWSSGNLNTALEVFNWCTAYSKTMSGYKPNGDNPITPDELRLIGARVTQVSPPNGCQADSVLSS